MKIIISLLICLTLLFVMTGCGYNSSSSGKTGNKPTGVNDVLQQGIADADNKQNDAVGQLEEKDTLNDEQSTDNAAATGSGSIPKASADGIDVDLTALSSTMVYSEVYNMMVSPEDYLGKTVRMQGPFTLYHDEASDKYYFACIIQDATACCAQGIEFVLKGEHKYPDDYPEVGTEICVTGVFDTYQEGQTTYCTLREASMQ